MDSNVALHDTPLNNTGNNPFVTVAKELELLKKSLNGTKDIITEDISTGLSDLVYKKFFRGKYEETDNKWKLEEFINFKKED